MALLTLFSHNKYILSLTDKSEFVSEAPSQREAVNLRFVEPYLFLASCDDMPSETIVCRIRKIVSPEKAEDLKARFFKRREKLLL